jgi:hypothetical protein
MSYSPESLEAAAKLTGLTQVNVIRADDLDELRQRTSRLAEFIERQKHLAQLDPIDFESSKLKPFAHPLSR